MPFSDGHSEQTKECFVCSLRLTIDKSMSFLSAGTTFSGFFYRARLYSKQSKRPRQFRQKENTSDVCFILGSLVELMWTIPNVSVGFEGVDIYFLNKLWLCLSLIESFRRFFIFLHIITLS